MKRVLFVSRDYNARNDGGSAVAKRNLAFLKALGLQVAELTIGVPSLAVRLKTSCSAKAMATVGACANN